MMLSTGGELQGVGPTNDAVEVQQDRKVAVCMHGKSSGKLHFPTTYHPKIKAV